MLKILILFFLILMSVSAGAYECFDEDESEGAIEKNFELASNVIFGRVLKGRVNRSEVNFVFEVTHSLKGSTYGKLNLNVGTRVIDPSMALGGYYLLFLYDERNISFCTPIYEIPYSIDSQEEFKKFTLREDVLLARELRKLLE